MHPDVASLEERRGPSDPAVPARGSQADGTDAAVRAEALDPRRSFIVRAPAGSGKTALLIQRLLRLLAVVDVPEEIVAITFTRKAAGEMRERLLNALRLGEAPEPPASPLDRALWTFARAALERSAERGWSVARHPNRLRIQTIDGFCSVLARMHPLRSGLGAPPQPVEDADRLYRDAARATLSLLDSPVPGNRPVAHAVAHLLRHRDVQTGQVEALLVEMLVRRDQWLRHLPPPGGDLAALRQALERVMAGIVAGALVSVRDAAIAASQRLTPEDAPAPGSASRGLGARLGRLARYACERADAELSSLLAPAAALDDLPGTGPDQIAAWRALAALLLTEAGEWRKPRGVTKRIGFPSGPKGSAAAAHKAQLQELLASLAGQRVFADRLEELKHVPSTRYTDAQWDTLTALAVLLRDADIRLRERFAAAGAADFVEVAQAAERAAAEPAWVDSSGIRHLLVDEFQDSSHSQLRLIERITAGWRPGDGRTLFLVGDPMQSIYRFREADVGLFLAAESAGVGGLPLERLRLEQNFRSLPEIVGANNRFFATVFPGESDVLRGAVAHAPAKAARLALRNTPDAQSQLPAGVHIHPIVQTSAGDTGRADAAAREARAVVRIARAALAEPATGPVAILVQARTHLEAILPALAAADVAVDAVALTPLDHRPAVQDLLSLTRALLYPGDRIAWLSVLRAPWCGLGMGELEALVKGPTADRPGEAGRGDGTPPQPSTLWHRICDADAIPGLGASALLRLQRVRGVLLGALDSLGREPLRATVEGAWLALGAPACIAPADDADVRSFFAVLEHLQAEGIPVTPDELSRRLARQRSVPATQTGARVQVMTIHEAKGLEFGTVILPGLHRGVSRDTRRLLHWLEYPGAAGRGLLLAPIPAAGADPDGIHRYLDRVEQARAQNERRRLLYVACTRACHSLHLVGIAQVASDTTAAEDSSSGQAADVATLKPPRKGTLLAALWPVVEAEFAAGLDANRASGGSTATKTPQAGSASDSTQGEADAGAPLVLQRLTAEWALPHRLRPSKPSESASAPAERAPVEYDWAGPEARLVGTVVHALLLRAAREGIARWDELVGAAGSRTGGTEVHQTIERFLTRAGLTGPKLDAAGGRVLQALTLALSDPRGRWVLGDHRDAREEWELTARLSGRSQRMTLDRTFIDQEGVRWVVDYKTGSHSGGSLDEFLDRELTRYRTQLDGYAFALKALDRSRPVRCGLYFPLAPTPEGTGGWRDWKFPDLAPAN